MASPIKPSQDEYISEQARGIKQGPTGYSGAGLTSCKTNCQKQGSRPGGDKKRAQVQGSRQISNSHN
jgi:hypothetical protein